MTDRRWWAATSWLLMCVSWIPATGAEFSARQAQQIDHLLAPWNRPDSPGASCAVMTGGKVVYRSSVGCANLEYGIPLTSGSVFNIASTSKQFAAFAVLLLEQDRKLSLEDDVRTHIPELPDWGHKITIRQLAHHTSGIREVFILFMLAGWNPHSDAITNRHALEMICRQRSLNFPPGSEYSYSNSGYFLLAEIVARVSGMSFDDFTRKRIFEPLRMHDSRFQDDPSLIVESRAYSYWPDEQGHQQLLMNHAAVGYTNLLTTVDDLCRWMRNFDTHDVGNQALFDKFNSPGLLATGQPIEMAWGQFLTDYRGEAHFHHAGSTGGYRAHLVRFVDQNTAVVVLTNADNISARSIAYGIIDIVLDGKLAARPPRVDALMREDVKSTIDAASIGPFCGNYWYDEAQVVRQIRWERGKLFYCRSDSDRDELRHLGDNLFSMSSRPEPVVVQFEESGGLQMRITDDAGTAILTKIDRRLSREDALRAHLGSFANQELPATYDIILGHECLLVKHYRGAGMKLFPVSEDVFASDQWFGGTIRFVKNADQNVATEFIFSQSRVRNLVFEKVREDRNAQQ